MSRLVGIDCGTTLRKYVWRKEDGSLGFRSSADGRDDADFLKGLRGECCVTARAVGIGERPVLNDLAYVTVSETVGNPIVDETHVQAFGVRELLGLQDLHHGEVLVVSVGSAVSYTVTSEAETEKLSFGNPIGGAFIMEMSRGAPLWFMSELAAKGLGDSLDLLYKHVFPEMAGTIEGEYVASHFGRKVAKKTAEQHSASSLNVVAVAVSRDLLLYRTMRPLPQHVAFIGTCVSMMPTLRLLLQAYAAGLKFTPHFPEKGEYSGAYGALRTLELGATSAATATLQTPTDAAAPKP